MTVKKTDIKVPKKRLRPENREQQILEEAVSFFAEKGISGKTRELAARLGITQPLLYRYFPTKRDLIEGVFEKVYLHNLNPEWLKTITDRDRTLQDRLCEFYRSYSAATYRYDWIRVYMFSALMGEEMNRRYTKLIEKEILTPICVELRKHCGMPSNKRVSQAELDHIWVLHGGLFYFAIRKHIYHGRVSKNFPAVVERAVNAMLEGTRSISANL